MSGRARAKRICQTAVGVLIDPQKAVYDFACEEVGAAFDRFFPDRTSPAQRLLAAVIEDFLLPDLEGDKGEHLAAVATDLFARHGLASAELATIAKLDLTAWAMDARDQLCRRGLTTRLPGLAEAPASWNGKPIVVVDAALEGRVQALVETFYARLIPLTLGSELRGAIDGYQTALLQEIAAKLDHLTRTPEAAPPSINCRPAPDYQGYDDERAAVREALAGGGTVAISALHGIGGVGKSELALKIAEEMAADFPDGQILVDMLGTMPKPLDAAEAMTDVLRALGAKKIDPRTRAADYQSRLRGKRLLILLDNVASANNFDQLRPPAPVALLVTSRTRLHIQGAQPIELVHLSRAAAKALLAGILPAVADANLDALAERCADLPLALRVAGAYLQETGASPEAFIEALKERRLAHLARCAGDMSRPDLDPSLVLGLSYDRLAETDPDLARSFTRLAVFPADFDSVAAAAVLDLGQDDAERHLGLLYRRNLVQRPSEGRSRLHDLLRELAAAKLASEDERVALLRLEGFFLTFLADYEIQTWQKIFARRGLFPTGMQHVNPKLFVELTNISYAIALGVVHNLPVARKALETLFSAGSASLSPMASPWNDILQTMERAIALLRAEDRELALARTLAMLGGRDPDRNQQMRGGSKGWSEKAYPVVPGFAGMRLVCAA